MKLSSKIRILRGPAALRVKMGVSQEIFAQYLGIAPSTVSMVERGQRPFPKKALQRLCELEIAWASAGNRADGKTCVTARATTAAQDQAAQSRQKIRKADLSRAIYSLELMKEQYNEIMEGFAHLQLAKQLHGQVAGSQQQQALERAEMYLHAGLARCNEAQQSKLAGRIARLEILIAGHEPVVSLDVKADEQPQAAIGQSILSIALSSPEPHGLFITEPAETEVAA